MVLVLFFLGFIILISILIEVLIFSALKIKIENDKFQIILYALGKIPIIKFHFDRKIIKEKIKKYNSKTKLKIDNTSIKIVKEISPKLERLDLRMKVGLEDAAYTSFITSIISIAISVLLPYLVETKNIQNIKYEIMPIFNRQEKSKFKHRLYNLYKNGTYYKSNMYCFEKKERW